MLGEKTYIFYVDDESEIEETIQNMEIQPLMSEKLINNTLNFLEEVSLGALEGFCSTASCNHSCSVCDPSPSKYR